MALDEGGVTDDICATNTTREARRSCRQHQAPRTRNVHRLDEMELLRTPEQIRKTQSTRGVSKKAMYVMEEHLLDEWDMEVHPGRA
jgi:hypothetical protein